MPVITAIAAITIGTQPSPAASVTIAGPELALGSPRAVSLSVRFEALP